MWAEQIILAVIGLSSGAVVAGGLFAFLIELGVIADFADRTHTADHLLLYEDAAALGGIVGNLFFLFHVPVPFGRWLLPLFGLLAGMFVGLLVDGVGGDLKCISDFCETVENCALYFRIYTQHGARKRSGSSAVFL